MQFFSTEDEFQHLQQSFMEKYYLEFDDSEENKLSYTPIFNEYVCGTFSFMILVEMEVGYLNVIYYILLSQIEVLEKHLEQQLVKQIPGFNMDAFTHSLKYVIWIHPFFWTLD